VVAEAQLSHNSLHPHMPGPGHGGLAQRADPLLNGIFAVSFPTVA
jgi:hypothetical protein